jgi:hypothetical protein
MKYKKGLFLIIGGILLFVLAGVLFIFIPRKSPKDVIESFEVIPYLKDGDVILRLGDGAWSVPFRDFSLTDKRFSHLGIVRIRDTHITVINSVGYLTNKERGVDEVSLEKFLQVARVIGVFRVKSIDGKLLSDKAVEYVDRPFDWSFDLVDDSKIYCTELLYAALKSAAPEFNLLTRYVDTIKKDVIPLDSISASSDFDEILYIMLND